ncbi:hypothetical protein KKC83_03265 [Patescibacteria group bacterium]|nr:hypothetical protein [Candidatus Falkowbacteria bacterium]MBU3905639.1 hypothetical protein [Patescibacteria group bacterium]MBU4015509.1 hypothetical protein [Patescibacteria group bacterium]MBU4026533.1 hypothetical protein [Patescibacteria group bacterium]MBU4073171.1 hypothetical protein [Patescibacteria group bacterium]
MNKKNLLTIFLLLFSFIFTGCTNQLSINNKSNTIQNNLNTDSLKNNQFYKSEKLRISFEVVSDLGPSFDLSDNIISENKNIITSTELVGSIIVLQKSANKTIEDSILKLVEQEGKDINNCKVIKWDGESKNEEFRVTLITPISEFSFTEEEIKIIEEADKNPDGPIDGKFERQLIYNKHAIELCSHYADPLNLGTCSNFGNIFLYNELKSKTKFLFLSPTNCDPYFYKYNTIELL